MVNEDINRQVRDVMIPYQLHNGYFILRRSFSKPNSFTVSLLLVSANQISALTAPNNTEHKRGRGALIYW